MEKEEMEKMENENIRQDIKDRKDSIIEDLRLISKIEPGQTISFVTREIMDHNSWYTSIRRSCYREDRGKTVSRIKSIFLESLFFYRCYKDDMVLFEIQNAKKGIESLEVTYSKDFNTLGILKEISDIIEKNLKEFAKRGTLEPIDSQYIENIYETLHDNEAYTEKKKPSNLSRCFESPNSETVVSSTNTTSDFRIFQSEPSEHNHISSRKNNNSNILCHSNIIDDYESILNNDIKYPDSENLNKQLELNFTNYENLDFESVSSSNSDSDYTTSDCTTSDSENQNSYYSDFDYHNQDSDYSDFDYHNQDSINTNPSDLECENQYSADVDCLDLDCTNDLIDEILFFDEFNNEFVDLCDESVVDQIYFDSDVEYSSESELENLYSSESKNFAEENISNFIEHSEVLIDQELKSIEVIDKYPECLNIENDNNDFRSECCTKCLDNLIDINIQKQILPDPADIIYNYPENLSTENNDDAQCESLDDLIDINIQKQILPEPTDIIDNDPEYSNTENNDNNQCESLDDLIDINIQKQILPEPTDIIDNDPECSNTNNLIISNIQKQVSPKCLTKNCKSNYLHSEEHDYYHNHDKNDNCTIKTSNESSNQEAKHHIDQNFIKNNTSDYTSKKCDHKKIPCFQPENKNNTKTLKLEDYDNVYDTVCHMEQVHINDLENSDFFKGIIDQCVENLWDAYDEDFQNDLLTPICIGNKSKFDSEFSKNPIFFHEKILSNVKTKTKDNRKNMNILRNDENVLIKECADDERSSIDRYKNFSSKKHKNFLSAEIKNVRKSQEKKFQSDNLFFEDTQTELFFETKNGNLLNLAQEFFSWTQKMDL